MPKSKFINWYIQFEASNDVAKDIFGLTREELIEYLDVPDTVGATSRKRKTPEIYKYDELEFHFDDQEDGRVWLIYQDDLDGNVVVSLQAEDLDWSK